MKRRRRGLPTTTILVAVVVSVVAIILCCCILLFLNRYRGAMVQSARTSTAQAVSQVSNTVGSYLQGMEQAMDRVEQAMAEAPDDRDRLLSAFLLFRPDVVAITSYSETGELTDCWALGREPREDILQNLSFDPVRAMASDSAYLTAPHVESIFESYYPWVVTMTAPLEGGGEAAWVSLDISFSSISSYLKNVSIGQRGYCFLMDREGNIVDVKVEGCILSEMREMLAAIAPWVQEGSYLSLFSDDGNRSDFLLVADSGPGERDAKGLIVPRFGKKPENHVTLSMTMESFCELLLLTRAHYQAWLSAGYARGDVSPQEDEIPSGGEAAEKSLF